MKKTELIFTDDRKFDVLIAERKRFADELNAGVAMLISLPFVDGQEPSIGDLKNPIAWWDSQILAATQPRKIKGMNPDPKQLAHTYGIVYDSIIAEISRIPWNAIDMLEYSDGEFQVTPKVEQKVRESASVFGTPEQKEEFDKLDTLLDLLNSYCDKFVTDRMNMNAIAEGLFCRYIQLPDKTRRIVPNARALINVMEHSNAIS